MFVAVLHQRSPLAMIAPALFTRPAGCDVVAMVDVPADNPELALRQAFTLTNNRETSPWIADESIHPAPSARAQRDCRSTSVGDLLALPDGTLFQVASLGFTQLTR